MIDGGRKPELGILVRVLTVVIWSKNVNDRARGF